MSETHVANAAIRYVTAEDAETGLWAEERRLRGKLEPGDILTPDEALSLWECRRDLADASLNVLAARAKLLEAIDALTLARADEI